MNAVEAKGCGDLFVFTWDERRTEVLTIQADRNKLNLRVGTQSLDVAKSADALQIRLDRFKKPPYNWPYCTDVGDPGAEEPTSWSAVSGRVTITLTERGTLASAQSHNYKATIRIEGVVLINAAGARISLDRPIVVSAVVGDYFG